MKVYSESMKVLVIGSKGFLGGYVLEELKKKGYEIKELVGDARKKEDVAKNIENCNTVINLIGIIRETKDKKFYDEHFLTVKNIVDAIKDSKIRKLVHVSALGVSKDAKTGYLKTKHLGEEYIANSGLDYTIFRPSIIFGKEDKSINYFLKFVNKGFFVVFGRGDYKLQPVYVRDVAKAIVDSIKNKKASNKIIEIAGNKQYTFNEMIDAMARSRRRKVIKIHVPIGTVRFLAKLFWRFSWFPITAEQLDMLIIGNVSNDNSFEGIFDIQLKDFEEYLKENAPSGI